MPVNNARRTLSVIVPALNEEANIEDAVREVTAVVAPRFEDYEILLFNDGSRDRTGALMDAMAAKDAHLRVTHNPAPRNLGGVYKQGIAAARFEYVIMVPGDNENPGSSLQAPLDAAGQADIVMPYVQNGKRTLFRRMASRGYVQLMNGLFALDVRYYNGTVIHRTENVRRVGISTDSFAYQSEVLVKLLRLGCSHVDVRVDVEPKGGRSSKAFRPKNLIGVATAIGRLVVEVYSRPREMGTGARASSDG